MTARRALAALALIFALAHVPFLAPSLEDIDSVNFALGVRDFDVATHRPHPPGYPVYIALGKVATAIAGLGASSAGIDDRGEGARDAVAARGTRRDRLPVSRVREHEQLVVADAWRSECACRLRRLRATAITASCPLFWYLGGPADERSARPCARARIAGLPDVGVVEPDDPGPTAIGDWPPAATAASGRLIVIGAFLAALSIGLRSQTVWFTVPLLVLVLLDRVGRGVAGAMIGGGIMFVVGGLAWGIPLLIASGGLNTYLAALGTQAGEDFAAGEMLYTNPNPRALAFALLRTFVHPWDSTALGTVVLILAAAGVVQLLWRDRRSLAAVFALARARTSSFTCCSRTRRSSVTRCRWCRSVAFLAVRGVSLVSMKAVPCGGRAACRLPASRSPARCSWPIAPNPVRRSARSTRCRPKAHRGQPGALAMHQTFVRPLEAEEVGIDAAAAVAAAARVARAREVLEVGSRPSRCGSLPIRCAAISR